MSTLTPQGEQLAKNIAGRYGLSHDSAVQMIIAVDKGGGTSLAQLNVPELGSGQYIGGVSQQQVSNDSLTFNSQHGTIAVGSLPRVSGPAIP